MLIPMGGCPLSFFLFESQPCARYPGSFCLSVLLGFYSSTPLGLFFFPFPGAVGPSPPPVFFFRRRAAQWSVIVPRSMVGFDLPLLGVD